MIEFNKTFGAANNAPAAAQTGTAQAAQPKARFWLNIGYSVPGTKEGDDDRFVSLPLGVPVDTQEHVSIQSRNVEYSQFQQARNDLLDQIMAAAEKLDAGEGKILNLQIQLRRISGDVEATPVDQNPFARQLDL